MNSEPDVFIIESLHPQDEGEGTFEGGFLSQMLRLHGKRPEYRYVRTRKEFARAVLSFGRSNYRYLHISAHGDAEGLCTTNADNIGFSELAVMLSKHLKDRRLFLSSCEIVHEKMVAAIVPTTECLSIVGPKEKILFSEAAIVWASIYHLMFRIDPTKMSKTNLTDQLSRVCELFDVELEYYARDSGNLGFVKVELLRASAKNENRSVK